jgi:hypothetical protein
MKKKVWIFGDSYSDSVNYIQNDYPTWPIELAKKYDVKNFSLQGTGPDWSLSLLNENMKSQGLGNLKDVTVIFLVSNPFRFNFSFYDPPGNQVLLPFIGKYSDIGEYHKTEIKKYSKYFKFYKDFLKYYAYEETWVGTAVVKITGSLKLYEHFFKKILVWPVFDMPKFLTVPQTGKFYYVNKKLYDIESKKYKIGADPRSNHLSKENHVVMLEQLSNWIEYNTPIDLSKFIYNVDQK